MAMSTTATTPALLKIESNGSGCVKPLEAPFAVLATHALSPDFEDYGNFIDPVRRCRTTYNEAGDQVYEDAGPMYPEHPTAVRFWGNFWELSHVFQIDTDDAGLIERLTTAIRANQATPAYAKAKAARAGQTYRQRCAAAIK